MKLRAVNFGEIRKKVSKNPIIVNVQNIVDVENLLEIKIRVEAI